MKIRPLLVPAWTAILLCSCAQYTTTNPPRSATEQLLLSTAADRAIYAAPLAEFAGKRVFVDGAYFDSYDSKYVLGTIRDAFSKAGARLVNKAPDSEITIEARSGALSIDSYSSLIGIPNTSIPVPLAGAVPIPEVALWKSAVQDSVAKLALLAYQTKSREHFFSSGPMVGKSHMHYYKILFIQWNRTDVPEKLKKK